MPVLTRWLFWSEPGRRGRGCERPLARRLPQLFFAGPWERIWCLYIFGLAAACAVLLADALLQRRRRLLPAALGVAFLGSTLPSWPCWFEEAGRSPFPSLEILPFAFAHRGAGMGLRAVRSAARGDRLHRPCRGGGRNGRGLDGAGREQHDRGHELGGGENQRLHAPAGLRPADQLRAWETSTSLGLNFNSSQEVEMKRSIQLEEGWRYLNIRISPLTDRSRNPFGRLTLWRDMTERKLTEDSRQRARDEMFVLLNAISSAASNTLSTRRLPAGIHLSHHLSVSEPGGRHLPAGRQEQEAGPTQVPAVIASRTACRRPSTS